MNSSSVRKENFKFIHARLRLAQALLEESDTLPGFEGYEIASEGELWLHPRHEREALVIYLLLTCFDRLGQERRFTTFQDWLKSKKSEHDNERQQALQTLDALAPPLEVAAALADQHQALYGVRNAFYRGVESLSVELQNELMSSISVGFIPTFGESESEASSHSFPLHDEILERKLKLKYLYDRRNRFTHRLEQYYASSTPYDLGNYEGISWSAVILDSSLKYAYPPNQEIVRLANGSAYVYKTSLTFVLFEVLHAAVESKFHRTDINLRFQVRCINTQTGTMFKTVVNHRHLKDFRTLESKLLYQNEKSGSPPT